MLLLLLLLLLLLYIVHDICSGSLEFLKKLGVLDEGSVGFAQIKIRDHLEVWS